ncbi:MAG: hypothetical protein JSR80_01355, partial [Verrucomicrobia bacterium]|nr:hypothetical protein [Verrucomicrobiota bacterium]
MGHSEEVFRYDALAESRDERRIIVRELGKKSEFTDKRLLCPSPQLAQFCISPVCTTSPYLRCCYISLGELLIELLEVTDFSLAQNFVFLNEAQKLLHSTWVAIGLKTDNLDFAITDFQNSGISCKERIISKDLRYANGYKHRSALLDLYWFDKMVYVSEYDSQFFAARARGITTDVQKKNAVKVESLKRMLSGRVQPPGFLSSKNGVPQIQASLRGFPENQELDSGLVVIRT